MQIVFVIILWWYNNIFYILILWDINGFFIFIYYLYTLFSTIFDVHNYIPFKISLLFFFLNLLLLSGHFCFEILLEFQIFIFIFLYFNIFDDLFVTFDI